MHRVTVGLVPPYEVLVGPGALGEVAAVLAGRRRVAVITQPALGPYAEQVRAVLGERAVEVRTFSMGDGEEAKTLATVGRLGESLAEWGLLRGDAVVALGGGVVGDTAGFVASVYYRGVDLVQVPTTLLAMVDAAIGGKTAVNLPQGKNLVGAFHQPRAVLADTATLATLPARELVAGLGEVAKYACMPEGAVVHAILETRADALLDRDEVVLAEVVAACAAIKAEVVAADPFERSGRRATLNYGHTLAHALETVGGYALLHGEAVAVGLVFADALAVALGRLDGAVARRHVALLARLGLPTTVPAGVTRGELVDVMRRDKKASGGLTFVLPGGDGLELVEDPVAAALHEAFAAVGAHEGVGD